jgi:hypothetical protein
VPGVAFCLGLRGGSDGGASAVRGVAGGCRCTDQADFSDALAMAALSAADVGAACTAVMCDWRDYLNRSNDLYSAAVAQLDRAGWRVVTASPLQSRVWIGEQSGTKLAQPPAGWAETWVDSLLLRDAVNAQVAVPANTHGLPVVVVDALRDWTEELADR